MNVIEPTDPPATHLHHGPDPHDEPSDAVDQDAGVRRWSVPRRTVGLVVAYWVAFLVVGLIVTVSFARSSGTSESGGVVSMLVWWAIAIRNGLYQLRTATSIVIHPDGTLLLCAPVRLVTSHVERVGALREGGGVLDGWGDGRRAAIRLVTEDGVMRLPRRLVTEDLVAALREGSPAMSVPALRQRSFFGGWP